MFIFIHALRGQIFTPLYELRGKCPHMQFLGRGQMSERAGSAVSCSDKIKCIQ